MVPSNISSQYPYEAGELAHDLPLSTTAHSNLTLAGQRDINQGCPDKMVDLLLGAARQVGCHLLGGPSQQSVYAHGSLADPRQMSMG